MAEIEADVFIHNLQLINAYYLFATFYASPSSYIEMYSYGINCVAATGLT